MIAVVMSLLSGPASACGPDFPVRRLERRAEILLAAPEGSFAKESARLVEPPSASWPLGTGDRTEQERAGLTDAQVAALGAAAQARSLGEVRERVASLSEELQAYAAGAWQFHAGAADRGRAQFARVVSLPATERPHRGLWARYMLGRLARSPERAREHFRAVREAVSAGAADPMGLAVASLGEEALTYRESAPDTELQRYAEQAAMGSWSGVASLLLRGRQLAGAMGDSELDDAVSDPIVRRLLVVLLWTGRAGGTGDGARPPVSAARLLAAIERQGIDEVPYADRLASLAYEAGDWAQARAYVDRSDTPLSWWIRAKLALRQGDHEGSAAAYAKAAAGFPVEEVWSVGLPTGYGPVWTQAPVRQLVEAEGGLLALSRGSYQAALRSLLAAVEGDEPGGWSQGWEDAAHVAERVLTIDELVAFVSGEGAELPPALRSALRSVLGRRLMRAGRPEEAAAFFDDPEMAGRAQAYAVAMARTRSGSPVDRAEGWLDAAAITRPGLDLFGTEGAPDYAVYDGVFERWSESSLVPDDPAWRAADEAARVERSQVEPDQRFHYRRLASRQAEAAADLLPTDSLAFAVSLCRAAQYVMMHGPQERVDELYLRYVREGPLYAGSGQFGHRCPEPDFEGLRARLRAEWWRRWGPVGAAGLGLVLLIAAGVAIRRARRSA